MALIPITQADLHGKKVLIRLDFNVPLKKQGGHLTISDTSRIDLALPTLEYILKQGASKVVMMSHLGRPKGSYHSDYSLEPVASYLAEKLGQEVTLTETAVDSGIKTLLGLSKTKLILLQNLRFHSEEQNDDEDFAKALSQWGDLYVNDAFGVCHRQDASVHAIVQFFPRNRFVGLLIAKEVAALEKITKDPAKPMVAVIGGAKVSDKIQTLNKLLPHVQNMLIGGAMAYPFLKAKNISIGKSLCSDDDVLLAKELLRQDRSEKIQLPVDHVCAIADADRNFSDIQTCNTINGQYCGLDIGPQTIDHYERLLQQAKTIFWNGPMGYFENEDFAKGTFALAKSISTISDCFTLVGGGDSVSAVQKSQTAHLFSHVSTGGGASLTFIEQGDLVALKAMKFGI